MIQDKNWIRDYRFIWPVYEYYEFVALCDVTEVSPGSIVDPEDSPDEYEFIRSTLDLNDTVIVPKGSVVREYQPLEETPNLFLEFAQIAEKGLERSSILAWLKKYGLLYRSPPPLRLDPQMSNEYFTELGRNYYLTKTYGFTIATTTAFAQLAYLANQALKLYTAYKSQKPSVVHSAIQGFLPKSCVELIEHAPNREYLMYETLVQALHRITVMHLDFVSPQFDYVSVDSPPFFHFTPGFQVPNLLSAVWLQFYWHVTNHQELERCQACGMLFKPTRKGQKFCPHPFSEGRSTCANRYYVANHRARKQASEQAEQANPGPR